MLRIIAVVMAISLLVACEQLPTSIPPTESVIQNMELESTRVALNPESNAPQWIETEIEGIDIGIWLPEGWEADTSSGLTLVERMSSIDSGEPAQGIKVYLFVPPLDEFPENVREHENLAYAALMAASGSPEHTGGAALSEPVAFHWNNHDAAYYLFTADNHVHGLVIALATREDDKIVVANITAPASEIEQMERMLPVLLSDLRVNRVRLGDSITEELPEALDFPLLRQ